MPVPTAVPPSGHLGEARQRGLEPLGAAPHLGRVAAELLPERDGRGVHQVGAARLDQLGGLRRLGLEGLGEVAQRGQQRAHDLLRRGEVDRGREGVVARLRGVHLVVGVHVAAEPAAGEAGDHLVGVHVRRRARPGLEHVDGELVEVLARGHLLGGGLDRPGHVVVEHAELGVRPGRRRLDLADRPQQRRRQRSSADREVLHRALGLRAVQGVGRHPHLAHRVVLDPELVRRPYQQATDPQIDGESISPMTSTGATLPSARS